MQLEQILSAAVAAVNANGTQLESIPSPTNCLNLQTKFPSNSKYNDIKPKIKEIEPFANDDGQTEIVYGKENINTADKLHNSKDVDSIIEEHSYKQTNDKGPDMPVMVPLNEDVVLVDETKADEGKQPCNVIEPEQIVKIQCKSTGSMPEITETLPPPVEVSFFNGEDENLEITSEQVLEMFESTETNSSSGVIRLNSTDHHQAKVQIHSNMYSKYRELKAVNNENAQIGYLPKGHDSVTDDKSVSQSFESYNVSYDTPPIANNEEIIEIASDNENDPKNSVPTVSSEVEVVTSDKCETTEYTTLTAPVEMNSVSSAVSGALQTIAGDMPFTSMPGATVDTTMDAEGQFVIKVLGPGIDISIPNRELSNQMNNNASLEPISDKEIMEALDMESNINSTTYETGSKTKGPVRSLETEQTANNNNNCHDYSSEENRKESKCLKRKKAFRKNNCGDNQDKVESNCKKKHSSVIAALRESIFRSKARKINNQLEKESENKQREKGNETDTTINPSDKNDKTKRRDSNGHNGKQDDQNPYPENHNNMTRNHSDPQHHCSNQTSKTEGQGHCHYNHHRSCGSPHSCHSQNSSSHGCYSPPHNSRNAFKEGYSNTRHHPYTRTSNSRDFHAKCRSRCCSPCDHSSNHCKSDCCVPRRHHRSSPCRCRCKSRGSANDSFMVVTPEDLPSILRKGCAGNNGSPIVMMEPDALSDTDGDSLKVQLVYLVRSMRDRRTSREVLSPHSSHNSTNIVPNSPDCSSNCSSGYTDHYSTPNNQRTFPVSTPEYHPTADTKWRDVDPYQPINGFETLPKSRQPSIPQPYDDTDVCRTYLRKPIEEWTYEDVIFFVMEACKELGIHMNGVIFRSSDNGLVLLRMTPNDFELRAPNQGQRLYDYFINFKMQHFVASGNTDICRTYLRKPIEEWTYEDVIFFVMEACKELGIHMNGVIFRSSDNGLVLLRMTPNDFELRAPNQGQRLYDYFINFKMQHFVASDQGIQHNPFQHMDHHAPPESYMYPSHHYNHQEPLPDIPQPFDHFQSSPGHSSHTTDSPLNEYVPQGYHYMEPLNDGVLRNGYDIPSAAAKIFPPLHSYEEPHSDTDEVEDEPTPEPPKKRGPGRPPKPESERKRKPKKNGKLWEFIRNLLLDPKTCPSLVRWEDALRGEFRIVQSDAIATKWGMRKNNEKMNYEKLSRAMRYYYKAKIFETVPGKRLVYKFGINAKGWRPLNINNPNFQN